MGEEVGVHWMGKIGLTKVVELVSLISNAILGRFIYPRW